MKILKLFSNVWFLIFLLIVLLVISIKFHLPIGYHLPDTSFYDRLADRSQYYLKELMDYNFQIYSVMMDEVRTDLNGFYLIISIVGLSVIILTLQIIAAITRLPLGYLAYPGKFLVIKKSNLAQLTPKQEGESK